ncbi:MAG: sugar phosphate nucleotidyltransferase [Planctomycetota bacterium]|jgi:mannose-1-phosphate guanylyltransferase
MPSESTSSRGHRWALVLAGGDGRRLEGLTRAGGQPIPKQFCSFCSDRSLLGDTLARARRQLPVDHVVVVVAEQHRCWWERDLTEVPPENVVVQPMNRGTAAGLLTGALRIAHHDREASTIVMPSDHFVRDEDVLDHTLDGVFAEAERWRQSVVLLGITPDEPDTGYGWIVPGEMSASRSAPVRTFVEKPERALAERLMRAGALWNSFLLAARVEVLLELYDQTLPWMMWLFRFGPRGPRREEAWYRDIYGGLPSKDVSRDILERCTDRLRVARAPHMGWSDLGTPERLARCLARRANGTIVRRAATRTAPVDGAKVLALEDSLARRS